MTTLPAPALPAGPMRIARLGVMAVAVLTTAPLALHAAGALDGRAVSAYKSWAVPAALAAAALSCLARAVVIRTERSAWVVLGIALALYAAGQVYWAVWLEQKAEPPFPSIADALWISLYPLVYAGLVLVARARTGAFRAGLWLDGVVGGAALGAVLAAVSFERIFATSQDLDTFGSAIALAYPLADLGLIALVAGVLSLTGWRPGTFWLLLGGGLAMIAVSDTIYSAALAEGEAVTSVTTNAMWALGLLAIGASAWVTPRTSPQEVDSWRVLVVPSAATIVALTVLAYGARVQLNVLAASLAALAVITMIARAYFTFREVRLLAKTQREAVTDYLTGLGNRRALTTDLEATLADATPHLLVLCDLDGFKAYNDRFGHPEGDLLLARLSRRLAEAVRGRGRAYRLGGDEFCVLIDAERPLPGVTAAVERALSERGDAFTIGCSLGAVTLPTEVSDSASALRVADERMYAQKYSRPDAAKSQAASIATGILDQLRPDLGDHMDGVAELAVQVGRRLGLEGAQLDDLRRAALLHDVGKIALPSSVLDKPGSLDEHESEFIRRHTLIGERMLAAAPALQQVAAIVRSTHERTDGQGYPDGLEGENIPLAARIIAVCDAYDAMAVTPRSYAETLTEADALAELERSAGTQFDPVVVEAFVALRRDAAEPPASRPVVVARRVGARLRAIG